MLTFQYVPLGASHYAIPFAVAAVVILCGLLLLKIRAARLHAVLVPQRSGHTEDSFVHSMADLGLSPRIARTAYRHLQAHANIRFPILVDDRLDMELGLDTRAIAQTIRTLLLENDRTAFASIRIDSIVTVEDLVGFIQASPRAEAEIAA